MRRGSLASICLIGIVILGRLGAVHGADLTFSPHVRSEHPWILQLLEDGRNRSPTLRRLLDHLEQSNGIVHIQEGSCPMAAMRGCLAIWMTSVSDVRFLRIRIDPRLPRNDELIALMAHELWHASEVLDDKSITSDRGMILLFKRIGGPIGLESYETTGGRKTEFTVARELSSVPTTPARGSRDEVR